MMIHLEDLTFQYRDSDFTLDIGELTIPDVPRIGVTGPSGCGKTTLLHLIAGILTPDRGRISVHGCALTDLSDAERRAFRLRRIGLIFQRFELLDYLTVRENILVPYYIHSSHSLAEENHAFAEQQARAAGIETHLDRYPEQLSQGERQRVAICRALVTEPDLILADEPTGNLDPETTEGIMNLIDRQVEHHGTTLLLATHEHDLLSGFDPVIDFQTLHD